MMHAGKITRPQKVGFPVQVTSYLVFVLQVETIYYTNNYILEMMRWKRLCWAGYITCVQDGRGRLPERMGRWNGPHTPDDRGRKTKDVVGQILEASDAADVEEEMQ